MATRQKFIESTKARRLRNFSEDFKRQKVREIEQKTATIAEVSRTYDVSATAVSRWLFQYNTQNMKRGTRTIVEAESDTRKLIEYKQRIAELERTIGQKQLIIDFQQKMIELTEQEYGIDIKKKLEKGQSSIIGSIEKI